ncbi:MAG: hypothetical protein H7Y17_15985 [Chlorobia bacterium]|nr:hypothetical protein [Fimbriimonadaceae bacterium]
MKYAKTNKEIQNPHGQDISEAAMAFEASMYPHASPETRRLLAHSRTAIRMFLASKLGR